MIVQRQVSGAQTEEQKQVLSHTIVSNLEERVLIGEIEAETKLDEASLA